MNEEVLDTAFDRAPPKRQSELIYFVMRKYSCDEETAVAKLRDLDEYGIAYVGVDLRIERQAPTEQSYDPMAEMLRS